MSDSLGWMTPWSLIPKGGVTPQGVQWPTECLDTVYCKLILMSCDQLWIAAECPTRLVLVRGISNTVNADTIKCTSLQPDIFQLGSMGEFDDIKNYLPHSKYPEGYTKSKKANLRRKCRDNFKLRLEFSEHIWVWLHVVTIGLHFKCAKHVLGIVCTTV